MPARGWLPPQLHEGKIEEKIEAEKIYDKAKESGQKTSLVAKTQKNVFRTNIANIGPGELITVEIKFQDQVKWALARLIFKALNGQY